MCKPLKLCLYEGFIMTVLENDRDILVVMKATLSSQLSCNLQESTSSYLPP